MKEGCCNEKELEIKQACVKEEEELIKPVEITEETCNFKEEELRVEEEEFKKEVCDDEKMQDEANQIIKAEKTENIAVIKQEELCNATEMGAKFGMGSRSIAEVMNTSGKDGLWCDICKLQCNSHLMMSAHRSGKKHKAEEAKAGFKVNKDQVDLQQDKKMREM